MNDPAFAPSDRNGLVASAHVALGQANRRIAELEEQLAQANRERMELYHMHATLMEGLRRELRLRVAAEERYALLERGVLSQRVPAPETPTPLQEAPF